MNWLHVDYVGKTESARSKKACAFYESHERNNGTCDAPIKRTFQFTTVMYKQ